MILGIGWATLDPAQNAIVRVLTATLHEGGHYLAAIATGAKAFGMTINVDGSGHVSIGTTDPLQAILTAASGMLTVALVSAVFLYSGLTRIGMHVFLATIGLLCIVLCVLVAEDPEVSLVLLCVGAITLFVGYMPGGAFLKSICLLYLAFVLFLGVLASVPYAYAEFTSLQPEPKPSDSKIIADALGAEIQYVGNALVGLMVLIYATSAIFVAAWLHQND
ncbi:MAG: M50 family metallopeptidase [Rhodobacter sp.]|nr:M50 family metallopeptidase [Rhodobacter sp.]